MKINKFEEEFYWRFEWVSNNSECIMRLKGSYGLSYSDKDFLQYVNEELLKESNEKAYIKEKPVKGKKKIRTLVF